MTLTLPITQTLRSRDVTGGATGASGRRTLADLPLGGTAVVLGVCDAARPDVARRLFDLGLRPGSPVTGVRRAPLGGPLVVRVADYDLTLRRDQARCVVLAEPGATSGTASCGAHQRSCGGCGA